MTTRALLRACAVAALTIVLTATAADAEVWRHADARHDAAAGADVTRVVVRHRSATILVDLHVRDLRAGDTVADVRFRTDTGRFRAVAEHREIRLYRGQERITECDNPISTWARFWWPRDTIRLRIPRRCFWDQQYPSWIRVQATLEWQGDVDSAPPTLSPRVSSPAGGSASRPA